MCHQGTLARLAAKGAIHRVFVRGDLTCESPCRAVGSVRSADRPISWWQGEGAGGTSRALRKTPLLRVATNRAFPVMPRESSLARAARLAPFLAPSGKRSTDGIFGAQIRSR